MVAQGAKQGILAKLATTEINQILFWLHAPDMKTATQQQTKSGTKIFNYLLFDAMASVFFIGCNCFCYITDFCRFEPDKFLFLRLLIIPCLPFLSPFTELHFCFQIKFSAYLLFLLSFYFYDSPSFPALFNFCLDIFRQLGNKMNKNNNLICFFFRLGFMY